MNPELLRNVWLELTPVRRWATPLVLLAIMALIELASSPSSDAWRMDWKSQAAFGLTLLCVFGIWASWKASNAVSSEVVAGTWDLQRLGQHRPWELLLGKLLGSSIFENMVATFGLGLFLVASLAAQSATLGELFRLGLTFLFLLWFLQSVGLMMSLVGARRLVGTRRPSHPAMLLAGGLLGLLVLGYSLAFLQGTQESEAVVVNWWFSLPLRGFIPLSLGMFLAWSLLLNHHLMRAELQESVGPLPWLGFELFLVIYLFPLLPENLAATFGGQVGLFCLVGIGVLNVFYYPCLLLEPKGQVLWRALHAAWKEGKVLLLWQRTPLWVIKLPLLGLAWLLFGLCVWRQPDPWGIALWLSVASVLLFMVRDAFWVVALHLSPKLSRSPDLAVLFFLALLYGLLPSLVLLTIPPASALVVPYFPVLSAKNPVPEALWSAPLWAIPGLLLALVWLVPRVRESLKD